MKILQMIIPPVLYNLLYKVKRQLLALYGGFGLKNKNSLLYDELQKQIKDSDEINDLFPPSKIKQHYVYCQVRDTLQNPDIFITQIRYFRVYQYLKQNYPEIFDSSIKVLDVGDTSGILFEAMGRKGTSLNINQENVDFIKDKGLDAIVGSAEDIQFEDKSFDYVFCFQCLEHLPNPIKALNELGRMARKKVFLSIPYVQQTRIQNVGYWIDLKKSSWGQESVKDVDCHIFEFSTDDFKKILSHTCLEYKTNFPINYFNTGFRKGKLLNKYFSSYFNFFVLRPIDEKDNGQKL